MEELNTNTRDTKLAAAFRTLGFPIKVERIVDSAQKWIDVRFHIGKTSLAHPELGGSTELRHGLLNGYLEKNAPAHPLLTCLRANRCRDRVLDFLNGGELIQLVRHPYCDQWTYEKGDTGLMGLAAWMKQTGCGQVVATGDLKMVCALGVVGFPLLAVEGSAGSRKFYLPKYRKGAPELENAEELMQDFRGYELVRRQPEHPLLWAMFCLQWREKYRREADGTPHVMIQKPGSKKLAFVRADASNAEWDRAQRHFGA